jgi:pyruvate, water dikinase
MARSDSEIISIGSGIRTLDELVQGLRLGDNVVWQTDDLRDYARFAGSFITQSIKDGLKCIYLRFASHEPVLGPRRGMEILEVDPSPGFDYFSAAVHQIIEKNGTKVCYIFDNLSDLVNKWATDELLANFFQVTCPYLFELETVTYFALTRNQHSHNTVARIRDTTQLLLDIYHVNGKTYLHPLKVWDRYSAQMFLPHLISEGNWQPVFQSGDAAAVSSSAGRRPIRAVSSSIAPWDSVYGKLMQYQGLAADIPEIKREITALRQELTRMMIGNHPQFIKLADRYLTVEDLMRLRDRMIGSGRIGGKAAGMLVARKVLLQENGGTDFSQVLEEHDSFFVGSDVFFTFLVNNNLFRLRLQLSKNSPISPEEFNAVEQQFLQGQFPREIMDQFRDMLDYYGQAPIIVRSSSLLEDSFGNAFAGKYRSEFCANQGNPEERLTAFLKAIKLVYASALNPDALLYRKKRGLGESDEQMAILVQRVSGMPYKNSFFPSLAGVAFSRNLYAWSDRIDPLKGMVRLVFGLGTRAVNRVGGDYPRMIAVSHPHLRPEAGLKIIKYSQKNVDLLDLSSNELTTRPLKDVLAPMDYPDLHLLVSTIQEDYLEDPLFRKLDTTSDKLVLTFNNLLKQTGLVRIISEILTRLEKAWGQPVDTEFTAIIEKNNGIRINLLQCRPLRLPRVADSIQTLPRNLPADQVLFRSNRTVSGGVVDDINYIIYIDPLKYNNLGSIDMKRSLGRVVGRLNELLRRKEDKIMAIGPGRWGSGNIQLGVNVGYGDINNVSVLVELALEEAGHEPEVSYGTHFFQDLVEADIIYLPVYPDKPATEFNTRFFTDSFNALDELLPEYSAFRDILKIIDVPAGYNGQYAQVIADPQTRKAVCYLK